MAVGTVRVRGLNELVRTFGRMDADLRRDLQRQIGEVANVVAEDARGRAGRYGRTVPGKIRPRVRGARGFVESRAASKHVRPNFGGLMMRTVLLPALAANEDTVVTRLESMLDGIAKRNGF